MADLSAFPARPPNAPPAATLGLGVQPGTSRAVIANYVIIFGAGGALWVYNPTPAKRNLVVSVAGEAGTDPYGNAYVEGLGLYTAFGPVIELRPDLSAMLIYKES